LRDTCSPFGEKISISLWFNSLGIEKIISK